MPLAVGDSVTVPKGRDVPAAVAGKTVKVVKIDDLSVWVEKDGQKFVMARSQVKKVKP
jgi:hypothetical protein